MPAAIEPGLEASPSAPYGTSQPTSRSKWRAQLLSFLLVIAVCFIAGGVTSFGQQYLPEFARSSANSAGSWTLVAFAAVYCARLRPVLAVIAGIVGLVVMNEGYGVVSTWRGFPYTGGLESFWTFAALLVGPVIGLAAVWMRSPREYLRALAAAAPSTVLIGEGIYGLTVIAETTSPVYWTGSIVGGVAFLTWTIVRRVHSAAGRAIAVLATAIGSTLFIVAYTGSWVFIAALFGSR